MTTTKLTIAYDGGPFSGWAAQPGMRTVQAELERALELVLREPVALTVAGRTDAGVHAWGQVASFSHPGDVPATLAPALNANLPPEIAVLFAERAADGFNARRDAHSRTYCYWIVNAPVLSPFERGRALHRRRELDRKALADCASVLVGTHDFTAFTPTETHHVRFKRNLMAAEWRALPLSDGRDGELLEFWVTADSFMRSMVRALVGTMIEVGFGGRSVNDFTALLAGAARELAGETAPAHGLYLASVAYGEDGSQAGA